MSTNLTPPEASNPAERAASGPALRLIQQIEELHRVIKAQTKDPVFLETVINGVARRLLESEALVGVIDRMIAERLRLHLSGSPADHHHEEPQVAGPKILGLEAQLHAIVSEDVRYEMKVQCRPANHPTLPLTLEAYYRDESGQWTIVELGALSKQAIREALRRQGGENGVFYWAQFFQITDKPVPGLPGAVVPPSASVVVDPLPSDRPANPCSEIAVAPPVQAIWPSAELAQQLAHDLRVSKREIQAEPMGPALNFKPTPDATATAIVPETGRFVSPVANDAVFSIPPRD